MVPELVEKNPNRGERAGAALMRALRHAIAALLPLMLCACAAGPDYVRPDVETPAAFKELPVNWKPARPSDEAKRGSWWEAFGDSQLTALVAQVDISNQDRKSTRLNSSHIQKSRMPSSA